jgi:hypothetical protein
MVNGPHRGGLRPFGTSTPPGANRPSGVPGGASPPGRTRATSRVGGASAYEGLTTRGRVDVTTRRSGQAAADQSSAGFGLLSGAQSTLASAWHGLANAPRQTQRALTASALGFLLLFPPTAGQIMHPGVGNIPTASPVATQLAQGAEIKPGQELRAELARARARVPAETGVAREAALRGMIRVTADADGQAHAADRLVGDAGRRIAQLREQVGWDAKLGLVADVYWFGVPDTHATFHKGGDDTQTLVALDADVRAAALEARTSTRAEIGRLLSVESPSFKSTSDRFDIVHTQLTAAESIESSARRAHDALSTAESLVIVRNSTPPTITVADYADVPSTGADGKVTMTRQQVGSHQEPNPGYAAANAAAIAGKLEAEARVKEMNETINAQRENLPQQLRGVDVNLVGLLDFFARPRFLVWSFDSYDIVRVKEQVSELRGAAHAAAESVRPEHTRLDRSLNRSIDMRWDALQSTTPDQS